MFYFPLFREEDPNITEVKRGFQPLMASGQEATGKGRTAGRCSLTLMHGPEAERRED